MKAKYSHPDCNRFETCSVPICPLDHPEKHTWYPFEDICNSAKHGSYTKWIAKQRKIAKKTGKSRDTGYFTLAMLNTMSLTQKQLKGIDPDKVRKTPIPDKKPLQIRSYKKVLSPSHLLAMQKGREKKRKLRK